MFRFFVATLLTLLSVGVAVWPAEARGCRGGRARGLYFRRHHAAACQSCGQATFATPASPAPACAACGR